MRKLLALVVLVTAAAAQQPKKQAGKPGPLAHTFSIVAYDKETGQLGVAVQSHWFCVGCMVAWAEAGVGAIATQSFVDPSYGKLGLDLMRAGRSAPDALRGLILADEGRDVRQVAFVDAQGRVGVYTGCKDIMDAGHVAGDPVQGSPAAVSVRAIQNCTHDKAISAGERFSVQANLMANDKVWPAMARAFESSKGDLADRMLAALEAAQWAGGDIRGTQSAALVVVSGKPTGRAWQDRVFDLRVDDAVEPIKEMRRLLTLARAYNHMNAGDLAVEKKDNATALKEYAAAEALIPDDFLAGRTRKAEMYYWHAVALVNMKRVDEALPVFAKAFALHPPWRELTLRLPQSGLLPDDPKIISRITSVK